MGDIAALASAGEIVEGPALTCGALAAVVAWNDSARPPLLRMNPDRVSDERRTVGVFRWARACLGRGRRLAALPAVDLERWCDDAP